MRSLIVAVVLVLAGCASMLTPRNLANARREMTYTVIGCPVSDTVVEEQATPKESWRAECLDRARVYECRKYGRATAENRGDGLYGVACDPVGR